MKSSTSQIPVLLNDLFQKFIAQHQEKYQCLPNVEYDAEWPSPCQQSEVVDDFIQWQPIANNDPLSFSNVEEALGFKLNAEFVEYFTHFYSESVPCECEEGYLELLFAWNKDDFERLQQNLIGHVLMKQKLKQEVTLFFAVTDEEDIIVSVDNNSGEVWAERVGKPPHKKLANSLSEFINQLNISL